MFKSRILRLTGYVTRMKEGKRAFNILTCKPTGKELLGRTRRRWEENNRMNLMKTHDSDY